MLFRSVFEDDDNIEQLVQELRKAHPSSFLISGYRGVGKTSFINRIKERTEDTAIFVNISLSKYEGYPTLIKKLIRQLYISYREANIKTPNDLLDVKNKLALLYDRTFNEISYQHKKNATKELKHTSEINFNIKKLFPIAAVLLSGVNLNYDFLNSDIAKYSLFILSLVWASISTLNFKISNLKSKAVSEEVLRKSLYDDEIAEHHLFSTLSELKQNKISTIIVFDELDKIPSTKAVEGIINELKALLLSGFANYFIVAGQGLYYQLEKSHSIDDPIITSLFAKTIHIPFLRYSTLKKHCLNLVGKESLKKEPLLNNFFDSLILDAARTPRKLTNQIRSRLVWEGDEAFIIIDEENEVNLNLESKLLGIINRILDNDLPKIINNDVNIDFAIAQIHLWLKVIKSFQTLKFTIDRTIKKETYNLDEYPLAYINQLNSLCELFFDRLIEEKILQKEFNPEEEVMYYSWYKEDTVTSTGDPFISEPGPPKTGDDKTSSKPSLVDSDFIKEFVELEQYVRSFYVDIIDDATWDNSKLAIKEMINKLVQEEVLNKNWINSNKLNSIIDTRNKVVHGMSFEENDLVNIQNLRFDIGRLKAELIEDYTYYVSKNYLTGYKVSKDNKGGFDFIATNNNALIAFEVKYLTKGKLDSRIISEIIDKFTNYTQSISSNSHYVLFFYQPNGRKSFDNFYSKFNDILNNRFPEIKERFHLYYASSESGDASTGRLQVYLKQVIEKIELIETSTQEEISDSIYTDEFKDVKTLIREKAKREWPEDFEMQVNEIERQEDAIRVLLEGKPPDISKSEFAKIRDKARREWPEDFEMRVSEEQNQIESLRKLREK